MKANGSGIINTLLVKASARRIFETHGARALRFTEDRLVQAEDPEEIEVWKGVAAEVSRLIMTEKTR